jgi:hypothetical protein
MTPVLIYTDAQAVADEIVTINKVVTLYQSVYTAIKAAGVTPTLAEIDNLVQLAKRGDTSNFINDYIVNKLLDAAAPYVLNGVTLTRDGVKNMMAVPNTSGIKTALGPSSQIFTSRTNGARLNLLALASDVISKVSDANAQITTLYTYYTQNDSSAQVATDLQTVCDALNTFDGTYNNFFVKKTPPGKDLRTGNNSGTIIPGLTLIGGAFVIDLGFIRKYEQMGTLDFVANA